MLTNDQFLCLEKISKSEFPFPMLPKDFDILCHLEKSGFVTLYPSYSDGKYRELSSAEITELGRAELEFYSESQKAISELKTLRSEVESYRADVEAYRSEEKVLRAEDNAYTRKTNKTIIRIGSWTLFFTGLAIAVTVFLFLIDRF